MSEDTPKKAVKTVKVRILYDANDHKAGSLVELSVEEAGAGVVAGWADDHPDAVRYAEAVATRAATLAEAAAAAD